MNGNKTEKKNSFWRWDQFVKNVQITLLIWKKFLCFSHFDDSLRRRIVSFYFINFKCKTVEKSGHGYHSSD